MSKARFWVCRKCKNSDCLQSFLKGSGGTKITKVGCQKVCRGPVAGIKYRGRMEWFARVDRAKPMVALLRAGQRPKKALPKSLNRLRVPRRAGQLRK